MELLNVKYKKPLINDNRYIQLLKIPKLIDVIEHMIGENWPSSQRFKGINKAKCKRII